eukprot:scaffold234317_cov45-Prasinocladus_malaysianus.AAC.1
MSSDEAFIYDCTNCDKVTASSGKSGTVQLLTSTSGCSSVSTTIGRLLNSNNACTVTYDEPLQERLYIPNTCIPLGGWFQPCRACRRLTAEEFAIGGVEVALCRRYDALYIYICDCSWRCFSTRNARQAGQEAMLGTTRTSLVTFFCRVLKA